jgi:chromate reductase
MTLATFDLAAIPLYNGDVEAQGFPESVRRFQGRIAAADALLMATPEYAYSVPGVLKNALDWASRPQDNSPLNGKPVALMGASTSAYGTARAQSHLRQVCVFTNMLPLNKPEVFIANAREKFEERGRLKDEEARRSIRWLLEALEDWVRRLRAPE